MDGGVGLVPFMKRCVSTTLGLAFPSLSLLFSPSSPLAPTKFLSASFQPFLLLLLLNPPLILPLILIVPASYFIPPRFLILLFLLLFFLSCSKRPLSNFTFYVPLPFSSSRILCHPLQSSSILMNTLPPFPFSSIYSSVVFLTPQSFLTLRHSLLSSSIIYHLCNTLPYSFIISNPV